MKINIESRVLYLCGVPHTGTSLIRNIFHSCENIVNTGELLKAHLLDIDYDWISNFSHPGGEETKYFHLGLKETNNLFLGTMRNPFYQLWSMIKRMYLKKRQQIENVVWYRNRELELTLERWELFTLLLKYESQILPVDKLQNVEARQKRFQVFWNNYNIQPTKRTFGLIKNWPIMGSIDGALKRWPSIIDIVGNEALEKYEQELHTNNKLMEMFLNWYTEEELSLDYFLANYR